jgi:AcrR family transcriptional regulator
MNGSPSRQRPAASKDVVAAPRSPTKKLLIDTGELLYGQHGFNGISLREIAAVAGQRNCNAVQYHFTNKQGFVAAILTDRVLRLDALRAQMFAELVPAMPDGSFASDDLLRVVWMPDLTILGADKRHSYIRFSLQYYLQPDAGQHPFYTRDAVTGRTEPTELGLNSCLFHINGLLRRQFDHLSVETFNRRFTALSMMYQCSVVEHDNEQLPDRGKRRPPYDIDAIIDMALGALSAPDHGRRAD